MDYEAKPSQAKPSQAKQGFTLIELSIVIVIIGLIIAGVTAGQSLVKSARLRSVLTNKDMYISAMNAFKMQYNGWAGDITNAMSYFPTAVSNGDGNRFVDGMESVHGWQHLKLAKLINNSNYDGVIPGASVGTVGITFAVSGYSKTVGFNMFTLGAATNQENYGSNPIYGLSNIIVLLLGDVGTIPNRFVASAALTPNQAYSIDVKIDDGLPNTGKILADNGLDTGITTCTNGNNALASNISAGVSMSYLGNDTVGCKMMFTLQ